MRRRFVLVLAICLPAFVRGQRTVGTVEIVEPADRVVRPGETITVAVGTSIGYTQVWFSGDSALEGAKGTSLAILTAPPYRVSFQVPANIDAGLYHVSAVGCRRAGDCDWFAPVEIDVEPIWPEVDRSRAIAAGPGVTIDTGGAPLVEHSEISYAAEAVRNGVGGLVVLKVTPNWEGRVQAVEVLEGPQALQKDTIKGALTWRFTQKVGQKPRKIEVRFDPVEAERAIVAQPAGRRPSTMTFPPTPGPITPQRIKVPAAEQAAKLISKTDPVYSPVAKAAHIQGVVHLSVVLGRDGRVIIGKSGAMVQVLKGPPLLASAAMEAVKQRQYAPTLVNGTAVEVVTEVDVEFFQLK